MRSIVVATVVIVGLLGAGLVSSPPRDSAALMASPGNGTPTGPPEDCTAEELARGELLNPVPPNDKAGVVAPFDATGTQAGKVLYVAVVTLLPDSCLGYRNREGGVVLFVQKGTVVYTARADAEVDAETELEIKRGDSDDSDDDTTDVEVDTPTTLHANDWITQDNAVWWTLRNGGDENAVISVAVYAGDPWPEDPCTGSCRKP